MGMYKDKKKRAKAIDDVGASANLILLGTARNKNETDELKVQQFIKSCLDAKTFLLQVMEDERYGVTAGIYQKAMQQPVKNLEDCEELGRFMLEIHKELKSQAGISSLMYPFFPGTISKLRVTSLELLIFLLAVVTLAFIF